MGRKSECKCKVCSLDFEENKELFYKWEFIKNGTITTRYKQSICIECDKTRRRKGNVLKPRLEVPVRKYLTQLKEKTPCTDCKKNYPYYVMHFDHKRDKLFHIGSGSKSFTKTLEEIEKCDIVCANCHAERTHKRILEKK